ncbi:VOC family protein [Lentzea sp. BCCO 10_0798]|jgi:catechol 2,3-dioxygenase-like lactoylglutathione lyase family enzyme|uniref:VOC family protein n=1 Tax=Lentzea kristufekii TaxID=3095430 RepID=A0ABU4U4Y3_9PSEU|nr:VOC family protein [Lentzea sp. BCCO 10_0798]MDX8055393.1 VOC family protein [Lentzea sp. BCCO 10_0798]
MDWTLEVIVVPVSDLDRSKRFYEEQLGFKVDHDTTFNEDARVLQLTPPGSGCSIVMGKGIVKGEPGTLKGVQLVVSDLEKARAQLVERGVEVGEIVRMNEADGGSFIFFDDPDGNSWAVQEIKARATGGEWK